MESAQLFIIIIFAIFFVGILSCIIILSWLPIYDYQIKHPSICKTEIKYSNGTVLCK